MKAWGFITSHPISCSIVSLVLAALLYMSVLQCRVQVVGTDGLPVKGARVLVMHSQGLGTRGFFVGVTDSKGIVKLSRWAFPHPMNSLSLWVVSPDEQFGGATASQWTRSIRITVDPKLPEVASGKPEHGYSFATPHLRYTDSKRLISESDWSGTPGESKFIGN